MGGPSGRSEHLDELFGHARSDLHGLVVELQGLRVLPSGLAGTRFEQEVSSRPAESEERARVSDVSSGQVQCAAFKGVALGLDVLWSIGPAGPMQGGLA